jgi:hypothetical protein
MAGPYSHSMHLPMASMMTHGYPIYESSYGTPYSRLSGPASHFDGVAFWYNPNGPEQLYDQDPGMFGGQGITMPPVGMEASSIKHRRTRSGCFTCRSRRVKVCKNEGFTDDAFTKPSCSVMRLDRYATVSQN